MKIELLTKLGLGQNDWHQESYEKHLCCQHLPYQHNGSSLQTWAPLIYLMGFTIASLQRHFEPYGKKVDSLPEKIEILQFLLIGIAIFCRYIIRLSRGNYLL